MSASIDHAVRIVRKALDAAPDDLDTFLTDECADDAELRRLAEAMLRDAAGIVDDVESRPVVNAPDALLGQRLGTFRVLERIGRGGMGVVYRGEREGADFTQVVALKLIRKGFDFDEVHARFLRERRILSRLSHPNLARFIDGGVAPDGRPWFALEFVQGRPLLAWCDDHRLNVRARVKLFLDVCAAVQYAHAQLVVHRDLKPGNVLVDADGVPRLLDFGISRLLGGDDGEVTLTVVGHHFALTPEYAAPEQFGGEAGVAADVYSLGAILYRLVAGVLPYPLDRRDLAEAERIVRATPPQALAQAITRPGANEDAAVRLAARSTSLRAYRAAVRGDLQRILDKALAKEPERRYATVEAFADDLSRWLDGAPVRVSGRRLGYRLGKFVKRNRIAVAFALLASIAAATGMIATLLQVRETRRETDAAIRMKDQMIELIEAFDSEAAGGEPPNLLELVQHSEQQLAELRPGSPLRRELAADVARLYSHLSVPDYGLELVDRELGETPALDARSDSARLRQTIAWAQMRLFADRAAEAWQTLEHETANPGNAPPLLLAEALTVLAQADCDVQRFGHAAAASRQALDLLQSRVPAGNVRVADARFALATALTGLRDTTGGRAQSEQVLQDLPPRDSRTRSFAFTKAALRRSLSGDYEGAEAAYAEGAGISQRLVRPVPRLYDDAMRAFNAFDLGRLDLAHRLIEPIRAVNRDGLRPRIAQTWEPWSTEWLCGELALAEHRFEEAAAAFGDSADAAQRQGSNFFELAVYARSLQSVALAKLAQTQPAASALSAAMALPLPHASYATAMRIAAHGVLADHDPAEATQAFDAALAELARAQQLPMGGREQLAEKRDAVRIRLWKAQAELAAGRADLARATVREARELGRATLGAQHPFVHELDELSTTTLPTRKP